jgi:hypothetical protein
MSSKEKILEKLKNTLESNLSEISPEKMKEIEGFRDETKKLNSNIDFYKASVRGCDALISTIRVMEETSNVSSSNLADILAATLLMFEKEGLIKIIRKEKK